MGQVSDENLRVPSDALTRDATVDVLIGKNDNGSILVFRLTDLATGQVTWLPMPTRPARQLAFKILGQAEVVEAQNEE